MVQNIKKALQSDFRFCTSFGKIKVNVTEFPHGHVASNVIRTEV